MAEVAGRGWSTEFADQKWTKLEINREYGWPISRTSAIIDAHKRQNATNNHIFDYNKYTQIPPVSYMLCYFVLYIYILNAFRSLVVSEGVESWL